MPTLIAVKHVAHFHAGHFHPGHFHVPGHWTLLSENMYDTVATICVEGIFSVTATIEGIWDDC